MNDNISILRGNDFTVELTVKNEISTPFDFTGTKKALCLRSKINGSFPVHIDTDAGGVIKGSISGLFLPTGKYYLDLYCSKMIGGIERWRRTRTKESIYITNNIEQVSGGDHAVLTAVMHQFKMT